MVDDTFLLLFNADHEPVTFTLPARRFGLRWALELSTAEPRARRRRRKSSPRGGSMAVEPRAIVILRRVA